MDEPQSPILSCKKSTRKANELNASPVLSNRKKRRKQQIGDSPVFFRGTTSSSYNRCENVGNSPVIENVSSPPIRHESPDFRGLKPKSLFPDTGDSLLLASPAQSQKSNSDQQQFIEVDSQSEEENDDYIIHEKTLSDIEEKLDTTTTSRSEISFATSQASSSFFSVLSTPEKEVVKLSHVTIGSARKKKQYLPNGLAKKLSRLLIRQETDYRLWRFQHKIDSSNGSDPANSLRLRIESVSIGTLHSLAHCYLESGNLANDRVSLVFSPERWKRFGLRAGDIVSIYEPWYSSLAMGGVTLLLGFNLLRKGVAASEVSKLSNTDDDRIRCDGACSSASADSIAAVAENRRPSTVTVLQTWSCPSQGCSCNFNTS